MSTWSRGGEPEKVARIEVVKGEHVLRALAEDGSLIAVYPASIGSEEKPAPSGTHKVALARNPTYTYNPEYAFKGVKREGEVRDQARAQQSGRARSGSTFRSTPSAFTGRRSPRRLARPIRRAASA